MTGANGVALIVNTPPAGRCPLESSLNSAEKLARTTGCGDRVRFA
jgi:hypothetical protein